MLGSQFADCVTHAHLIILFSKYQKQLGVIMEPSLANLFFLEVKATEFPGSLDLFSCQIQQGGVVWGGERALTILLCLPEQ